MLQTVFGTRRFTRDARLDLDCVSSFSISNPGATDVRMIVQGVPTVIPYWDKTKTVVPIQFDMNGDGTLSNIELDLEFETGAGEAIVYFRQQKTQ